jgi:ATP-dependent helicase/nuclease subunit A
MPELVDQSARDQIRTALDRNLVVEAAAGTGKTTELVLRIVTVLAEGLATVESIVAVTFTEKAAGELKLRVRAGIEAARQDEPAESARRKHLEAALALLEETRLGTIHAFCADLLRERSIEAGVDPLFETLTEPEAERLYRRAFELWLQEKLSDPPEGVRRSLRRRPQPSGWAPRGPESGPPRGTRDADPIGRLRQAGWSLIEWRDHPAAWSRRPFERTARIDSLVELLHGFADLSARCARPKYDNFYKDTAPFRQKSRDIRASEQVRRRDYDGIEALLVELAGQRVRSGSGAAYGEGASRAEVRAAHAALAAALTAFARDADADLAALLHAELGEVVARYELLKRQGGRLDFVDLLLRARDLIRDCKPVRSEFQDRFTHLFVDEFQDTDPLQAEILLLLAADDPECTDWRAMRPSPGKLFLVADPKQSIYRFRRADIGTYLEVKELLLERGALSLQLTTSFRAVPDIQNVVNAAFVHCMDADRAAQQADYVPLSPWRQRYTQQPAVVALPVPRPYGKTGVTKTAIDQSLPDAVAAFVDWLLRDSGWTVSDRDDPERREPIAARDVCLLLRRFDSFFAGDVTRGYVLALEARGIRHLLVGGRSFHVREEVETLRTALAAIERPDDELSVFATLHGALFAVGDEELLEYRTRHGRLHPFRIPAELRADDAAAETPATRGAAGRAPAAAIPDAGARARLAPIAAALELLAELHRHRNSRPIAETIHLLLECTRAHAGFALRPSGEQVLANVLHVAEQARGYERAGGISFRGFVDQLEEEALGRRTGEAPILEEGSDGVRIMTVHKAKGLEFPVVILADMTANLALSQAARWIDPERRLCAQRLAGWSPAELLEHQEEELRRDAAEGVRIAYVAATRARDLLVVPAVGDSPFGGGWSSASGGARAAPGGSGSESGGTGPASGGSGPASGGATPASGGTGSAPTGATPKPTGWIAPLNAAIYPPPPRWSASQPAPGCPRFGDDSVCTRPFELGLGDRNMRPGLHEFEAPPQRARGAAAIRPGRYEVVWWDPSQLRLDVPPQFGIRQEELLSKEADPADVEADAARYRSWEAEREQTIARASVPTLRIQTATERAKILAAGAAPVQAPEPDVEVVQLPVELDRPYGPRFGALAHAVLATSPLHAQPEEIARFAELQGRVLGATAEETTAVRRVVQRVLAHPLLERARNAAARGNCRRETPVSLRHEDGTLIEGVVDLAFLEGDTWTVVDFKTDRELVRELPTYKRQVATYAEAIAGATGQRTHAVLLRI